MQRSNMQQGSSNYRNKMYYYPFQKYNINKSPIKIIPVSLIYNKLFTYIIQTIAINYIAFEISL